MRKKIFTFLLALAASVGMMNAKVTWDSSNMSNFYVSDTDQPYTLEGVTLRTNASLLMAYCDGNGDEIHFISYETGGFTFSNTLGKNFTKIEMFLTSSGGWGNANLGSGWSFMNNGPVTWTGNASTVDLLKDEDDFGGASVKIVFYFEGDSQEPEPEPALPSWVRDGDDWDDATNTLTVNSNPGVAAYAENFDIQHLVISNSVTSIGDLAFGVCTGITSIDIPSSVTSIGNSAFSNCINATSLTIPNSVVSIGVGAFSGCNKLTSVTIPNSVTSIGTSTFRECSNLTSVTIPNSVTSIGDEAFRNCTGITSIEIPNSVISIGKMAFQYCGLTSVTIPNSVTSIGEEAFQNCTGMTSVTIPNSITSIEKRVFQYCGLTSVTIPSSVTTIGVSAFAGCEALTSVTIPNGVTTIKGSAFQYCTGLTSVTISSSVTSIEELAFLWSGNIADVYCYPNAASLTWVCDQSEFKENKATYCHVPVSQWAAYEAKFSDVNVTFIGDLPDPTPEPDPDPVGPIPCTAADRGKVLCTDGSIYATVSEATAASKTTAAVIVYVDTENGKALALALANESGTMDWETAKTTAAAHTPAVSGGTWTLPSKDDWDHMINAAGGYNALRDCFSGVGGTDIQKGQYWTSTEYDSGISLVLNFGTNDGGYVIAMNEDPCNVRACLAFDISAAPAPAEDVDITPNVDPQLANVYYSTFFDSSVKYELPAGVEAYVADLSGANLLLTKIAEAGEVIPANVAVILKSTVTPFTLTVSDADAVTFTATNDLQGSDTQIATPANCYVLAGTDGVVGFYHYTASQLNAHKAYVVYSGSNQAPRRMPFIFDQATGVENIQGDNVQSTKMMENGVLYIIKNGVKYNAQGQIVK